MSDRRIVAWHIQAQSHAGTRYIIIDPDDRNTTIGSVVDAGGGAYSLEAFGPQPRDSCESRLYAGWSHYGGTVDEAKANCLLTIQDFWRYAGLAIETAAAAPVQAPLPQGELYNEDRRTRLEEHQRHEGQAA